MENLYRWEETVATSLQSLGQTLMNTLPNVIGALLLLFVGWLMAKAVSYAIRKLLKSKSMQRVTEWLNQSPLLQQPEVSLDSVQIISRFVYWVILLLFFIAASETLGWAAVSRTLNDLINYLPALLSALVIALIGLYIAQTVRNVVRAALQSMQIGTSNLISSFLFYVLAIIVILTALEQASIDTNIITANLTLIIGAMIGAFALSFAIASRHVLENILASYYSRRSFAVGDRVRLDNVEGEVVRIDSISVAIKTEDHEVVFPARFLIEKRIDKLS